ncbi:MAG: glycosyltransferase [Candidatus Lokiarchaeota archaeon]|nr:glycosyltransferase [Candidatus Lokiarchaeota archaeon]MBD3201368.1 glycosyltransferase [Candidatus Lokiarchaeota archaeon]
MINLLYFPTRYFPSISGAELYIQRLAEILNDRRGYNVDVVTSNAIDFNGLRSKNGKCITPSEKYYDEVNNLKINRFRIDYMHSIEEKIDIIKKKKSFKSLNLSEECLKKFIENGPYIKDLIPNFINNQKEYDLIHTTFFPYFNLILTLIMGRNLNIPTVCTPFFHFANPRYLDDSFIEILPKFDKIIACTQLEKKILEKKIITDKHKIEVIPMGVDFEIFNNFPPRKHKHIKFKKKFFQHNEEKYKMVLFCGYKNYEKGAISILKSIPYILRKYKKVYFIFIGPSTYAFNLELTKVRKNDHTRILNFTPDNLKGYFDKYKLAAFNETDIYLMPSRSDAFGIAFLEAWASGKPVIGANIGATPQVIRNNIDGLLVNFDQPEEIAEKVIYLLKHRNQRFKLGKAGRDKVLKKYTWNKVVDRTSNLYKTLVNNNKRDYI